MITWVGCQAGTNIATVIVRRNIDVEVGPGGGIYATLATPSPPEIKSVSNAMMELEAHSEHSFSVCPAGVDPISCIADRIGIGKQYRSVSKKVKFLEPAVKAGYHLLKASPYGRFASAAEAAWDVLN